MEEADVDVPKVRLPMPGWLFSHCFLAVPLGGFFVKREFTSFVPPPIWKGIDLQIIF